MVTEQSLAAGIPGNCKGVIRSDEALKEGRCIGRIVIISNDLKGWYFFSDTYLFTHPVLKKHWNYRAVRFPTPVPRSDICPGGVIDSIEKLVKTYYDGMQQILSNSELALVLDEQQKQEA